MVGAISEHECASRACIRNVVFPVPHLPMITPRMTLIRIVESTIYTTTLVFSSADNNILLVASPKYPTTSLPEACVVLHPKSVIIIIIYSLNFPYLRVLPEICCFSLVFIYSGTGSQSQQPHLYHDEIHNNADHFERDRDVVQRNRSVVRVQDFESVQALVQPHRG